MTFPTSSFAVSFLYLLVQSTRAGVPYFPVINFLLLALVDYPLSSSSVLHSLMTFSYNLRTMHSFYFSLDLSLLLIRLLLVQLLYSDVLHFHKLDKGNHHVNAPLT